MDDAPPSEFDSFLKQVTNNTGDFYQVWRYALAMLLINEHRATIVEFHQDGDNLHLVVITSDGKVCSVMRPPMSEETEQLLLERMRHIYPQDLA